METQFTVPEPTREEIDALPGPVVLEFGTDWCPHCQALQRPLASLLGQFSGVRHIKIEDGKGRPLGRAFRVKVWPNLVFLRDGKVVAQLARPSGDEVREGLVAVTKEQPPANGAS